MIPVESQFKPGVVVVPGGVTPRFNEFFNAMISLNVPGGSGYLFMAGPDCDTNRNKALRELPQLDVDADWALFLDDDQKFQPDTLLYMLGVLDQHPEIDALTGWYVRKKMPFQPVLYRIAAPDSGKTFERLTYAELAEARKRGPLFQIGACGGGMLLARRKTLDLIGDPWFSPGPGRAWGGDIGFGGAMLRHGLKLFVDLSLSVGHMMPSEIKPEWNEREQRWYLKISHGRQGFRVPVEQFEGVSELAH